MHNGDQVDLSLQAQIKPQHYLPAPECTCQMVTENSDLLVVNKPAGIKTHPNQPGENGTLFNQLALSLATTPLMLHRLDMSTSGLLMVGKNPLVIPILERELAAKTLERTYIAVTRFDPHQPLSGKISLPIGLDPNDKRKRMIRPDGLPALTHYKVLQHNSRFALVRLALDTGRTHQIRVHLASRNMPVLGDPLYSSQPASRMYLHAYRLRYQLPFDWKFKTVTTAIPVEFEQLTE